MSVFVAALLMFAAPAELDARVQAGVSARLGPADDAVTVLELDKGQVLKADKRCYGWVHIWFFATRDQQEVFVEGWVPAAALEFRGEVETLPEGCPTPVDPPNGRRRPRSAVVLKGGLVSEAAFAFRWNQYVLVGEGLDEPEDSGMNGPYYGARVTGEYWFQPNFGAQFFFDAVSTDNLSADFVHPITQATIVIDGIHSTINSAGFDLVGRIPLRFIVPRALVGVRVIDYRVDAVIEPTTGAPIYLDSNRYAAGILGGGVVLPAGRVELDLGGHVWVLPSLTERHKPDPSRARGLTGDFASALGGTFEAGASVRIVAGFRLEVRYELTRIVSQFEGDGFRFGQTVTNAAAADTFSAGIVSAAYRF